MKLRKKLSVTIASMIISALVAWLGTKNIDLTPDQQLNLTLGLAAVIGIIVSTFNIGQGIADKGKEAGKTLLVLVLAGALMFSPVMLSISMAQDADTPAPVEMCRDDLEVCEELFIEAINSIEILEADIIEMDAIIREFESASGDTGEASIGDLFDLVPAYRRLPGRTKLMITSIFTLLIGVGVMYIPPPK